MANLKANFSPLNKLEVFYSEGRIQVADDDLILCPCNSHVNVFDTTKGVVKEVITHDDDSNIVCFTLSPNKEILVTASNELLRHWEFSKKSLVKMWKSGHRAPISCMDFDSTSTLLCTGGGDSCAIVWNIEKKECTNLFDQHSGVVSLVKFNPRDSYQLLTSCNNYKINMWDLRTNQLAVVFEGHFSLVTSIVFPSDSDLMYSSSQDRVILMWNLKTMSKKILPVFENVSSMVLLRARSKALKRFQCIPSYDDDHFVIVGNKGVVSIWNASSCVCVVKSEGGEADELVEGSGFVQGILSGQHFIAVTHDRNIFLYDVQDLSIKKQFVSDFDSITDIKFISDNHLMVSNNSHQLRIYETKNWSCSLYDGHTDIIVSIDSVQYLDDYYVVTGSKDNSIRIWFFDTKSSKLTAVCVGDAHTHTVNSVCFFKTLSKEEKETLYVISGSEDKTLKLWLFKPESKRIRLKLTVEAHEKEINAVAISPDYKIIATGSRDKKTKLWNRSDFSRIGELVGHKRGVLSLEFSKFDRVLVTASKDETIKLWDISTFTCLKSFVGHESGIVKVSFISKGLQLISIGSDGLMKLWSVKTNECKNTIDAHNTKVWAMAVNEAEDRLATGAVGTMIYWKDVTEEEKQEKIAKEQEFVLKDQELSNFLRTKQYSKALALAIDLDQPKRALLILKELVGEPDELVHQLSLLEKDHIERLLGFTLKWNQNSNDYIPAQLIVKFALNHFQQHQLLTMENIDKIVSGMLTYTDRHFTRVRNHCAKSTFASYLLQVNGLSNDFQKTTHAINKRKMLEDKISSRGSEDGFSDERMVVE